MWQPECIFVGNDRYIIPRKQRPKILVFPGKRGSIFTMNRTHLVLCFTP